MIFDYSKLRGRIVEMYGSHAEFCEEMNMSSSTLSFKLNNKSDWSIPEMVRACNLLKIPLEKAYIFFLSEKY